MPLPFHSEGHLGSYSQLKRRVVRSDGAWGAVLYFLLGRKALPSLATGSKALQTMPPSQSSPSFPSEYT